jgi:hypothetical protein
MILIYDEYNDYWVWVEEKNHDIELSPVFDEEEDAKLWQTRIINILLRGKNDIQQN